MVSVECITIVRLHQTRVRNTTGRGSMTDTRTAVGLLQNDGEDEAMVDFGDVSSVLNRIFDVVDLLGRVVGPCAEIFAGSLEGVEVVFPHVVETNPLGMWIWEVGFVPLVVGVGV